MSAEQIVGWIITLVILAIPFWLIYTAGTGTGGKAQDYVVMALIVFAVLGVLYMCSGGAFTIEAFRQIENLWDALDVNAK